MRAMREGHSLHWLRQRGAGMLLHPTALPGDQGVGTLGKEALRFLDFLKAAGMTHWQICPLGPTGYGDSPYQCFSAFAGNPYLIDLDDLTERGLLLPEEIEPLRGLSKGQVDFGGLYEKKGPVLEIAFQRFKRAGAPELADDLSYERFKAVNQHWLVPYALFRAIKDEQGGKPWPEWPQELRHYPSVLHSEARRRLAEACDAHSFHQYAFFVQWRRIREQAALRGVDIIGDLPIFVAGDSADVWANPDLFDLDPDSGQPRHVAGVPPDYFSADGQLWGNPLYLWDRHRDSGFHWWHLRLEGAFKLYDIVRIDHFRGFDAYWEVPYPATNAREGRWVSAPGAEFFRAVSSRFPEARIIAEDLGLLSESVVDLRERTGLPGMEVLQFAFGGRSDNFYLPHNHQQNAVVYAGTHDNDTSLGWYGTAEEKIKDHARRYLRVDGREIGWDLIRAAYGSVSRLAIVTLPDVLSLGSEARFNTPGQPNGNWQWRYQPDQLTRAFERSAAYLKELAILNGREPRSEETEAG
ncbi:MAG: 4-alpha-glucanotransferase [Opitutaceae bacterium]